MSERFKLGIAPINWRNDDMPQLGGNIPFEQIISEMALAGYEGTEVGGSFPTDTVVLKKALDLRNLRIASQWFSSYLCSTPYEENEKTFRETLEFLKKMGANKVNVCELTRCLFASKESMFGKTKPIMNDDEKYRLYDGLNKLGKIAVENGFDLCFHHHMGIVVQSLKETKELMDNTDPQYVHLCYDTGHFTFAGEDALLAVKEFMPRIRHVHLKDIRKNKMEQAVAEGFYFRQSVLEGCFTVPGDGFVDFPSILNAIMESDYKGWLLVEAEQDPALANPLEYAIEAKKYIDNIIK